MADYNKAVLTGYHFLDGNHAACEGAIAAGCRFVAGYPITPSTEIVERYASRIPLVGGHFIQMEDEIASSIAILGAVWGGAKAMTVTSGPGFSLMMEHIGLAVISEVPVVFVDVQRAGPSTGLPTLPGQADIMQCRWGSHGDYEIIALSPNSPQECFDLIIVAFNLAEQYRVPVMFMMDECVGHMTEKVVIPPADEIKIYPRRFTKKSPAEYLPFEPNEDLVPDIVKAGDGYNIHVTGLTHDERGYPVLNPPTQDKLIKRLINKIKNNEEHICLFEISENIKDVDVIVLSYGITSRVALRAIHMASSENIKVGQFRLLTIWPFPEKKLKEIAEMGKPIIVPEMNMGQVCLEVERCVAGKCKVISVPHAGGNVHEPEVIYKEIINVVKGER